MGIGSSKPVNRLKIIWIKDLNRCVKRKPLRIFGHRALRQHNLEPWHFISQKHC